jgi:hypothetical protein
VKEVVIKKAPQANQTCGAQTEKGENEYTSKYREITAGVKPAGQNENMQVGLRSTGKNSASKVGELA